MGVPTHGPRCQTVFSRPARCQACDRFVYYWGCTCGSRVLFDVVGESWAKHRCTEASSTKPRSKSSGNKGSSGKGAPPNVTFINTYTYGVLSVVCPGCGKSVRKKELDAHNYYTHGIGRKPEVGRSSSSAGAQKRVATPAQKSNGTATNQTPQVDCPLCDTKLLKKNLQKHLRKKCPKVPR